MLTKVMVQVIINAAPPATEMTIIIGISSLSVFLVVYNRPQDWSEVHDLFTTVGSVLLSMKVDTVDIGKCDVALDACVGKNVAVGMDAVELVVESVVFLVDVVAALVVVLTVDLVVVFIVDFVVVLIVVFLDFFIPKKRL